YNVLYVNSPGGTNYVGYYGSGYSTLAAWQTANGGAYDQNSSDADPLFANPSAGDFTPQNPNINDIGGYVGVKFDINGALRDTLSPDPGAIEFTPPQDDAGVVAITSPTGPVPGTYNVVVDIKNYGAVNLNSANVYVRVEGTNAATLGPVTWSNGPLAPGATDTGFVVGSLTFNAGVDTIYAWTALPNGNADANNSNDTAVVIIEFCSPLAGSYTINQNAPASSTNFTSFNAAVNKMISCGISGPVTFSVTVGSGPYTEQVSIPYIQGAGPSNTILFRGNGETLQFANKINDYPIITLDGAKHVTFNDLRIVELDSTYGWGILLTNQADSNSIINCTIDM
ncbi:MAG: hypothetical protein D6706_19990, partial [Chloroflexi bacterium]